jgi:uncharacterized protein (TIGR03118 family)
MLKPLRPVIVCLFALLALVPQAAVAGFYQQTNLVTSVTDPDLINPWGISSSAAGPFWVSDNGTGKSTLYNSLGVKQGLVVSMPDSDPITGQVFNGTANFHGDTFLFASEAGNIDGWRGALGTNAENLFTVADAVYKGLAISPAKDTLYAANFHAGTIDVFSSAGKTGSFSDPTAPAGYAPFNVQNIDGTLYVTFAVQDASGEDDVPGAGHGLIDVFDPVTHAFTRLASNGVLDSPWGLALAPAAFGAFAGDLLVGNFGDGKINAFDPVTGASLGALADFGNNPLVNLGLWGLKFGNGVSGGTTDALYLTAGGAEEATGLFARIDAIPEPGTLALLALGLVALAIWRKR